MDSRNIAQKHGKRQRRKVIWALISLTIGVMLFVLLLKVESVALEKYQTNYVVVAKQDIASGENIQRIDIKKYFKCVQVNSACAVDGFSSLEELEVWMGDKDNLLIKDDIKEKEIVYAEKFSCVEKGYEQYEQPVEVGVKVSSYEYCVGGILRTGDLVDLSIVNLDVGSEIILEDVLILKAFDSSGAEIVPEDKDTVSVGFNLMMEKRDFEAYNTALENGTIRITKKFS